MKNIRLKGGVRAMPAYVTTGAIVGVTTARKAQSVGRIDEVELSARVRSSTGFQMSPCGILAIFDTIAEVVREGYDVDLAERCRFFACVNKAHTQLEVVAQTTGSLRRAVADIPFAFVADGEAVSERTLRERAKLLARERAERAAEEAAKAARARQAASATQVTPDMQVTCPNCGTTFRVGRRVAA